MSFLSTQYGWAATNVVNYEVVLANGTVANANAKENTGEPRVNHAIFLSPSTQLTPADLFDSLKGGGNNFGVVTAYAMQTHPMDHQIWGVNYIFTPDSSFSQLCATSWTTTQKIRRRLS